MKKYWVVEAKFHAFITLALDGDEVSASRTDRFVSRGKSPTVPIG